MWEGLYAPTLPVLLSSRRSIKPLPHILTTSLSQNAGFASTMSASGTSLKLTCILILSFCAGMMQLKPVEPGLWTGLLL
jgi:hypothetical protein